MEDKMHSYEEPVYQISIVATMLGIHPQTLRHYEREGLVVPSRTVGKIRVYSQKDIDDLRLIMNLTRDLGVNLAGVDIIIRLKHRVYELEKELLISQNELKVKSAQSIIPKNRQMVVKKSSFSITVVSE
jgi:MerR family transcriptional regulator/heat shock protein HspR